jgi:muramoyltetrapeptide carboxypeptidase
MGPSRLVHMCASRKMNAGISTYMQKGFRRARKPKALAQGSRVAIFSPSSPADASRTEKGIGELKRLGFSVEPSRLASNEGYFTASAEKRCEEFLSLLANAAVDTLFALRGGYGSNYLIDHLVAKTFDAPKCLIGYSDLTSLQIFLWQRFGWITFYGPMVAAGLDAGAGAPNGYDEESLRLAMMGTSPAWKLNLGAERLVGGESEGCVIGGCLTLIETTLGTPWELSTESSILLLEDRGMKPWQVDRALMHLKQAGKFNNVCGIILGDFPECEPPVAGSPTVRDVCARILAPLGIPIVFGAAIGHTPRPILTVPLGARARLRAEGEGVLEILEPAVVP